MNGQMGIATVSAKVATIAAASSSSSSSISFGPNERPAYYKIPSAVISHLQLQMPQLRVKENKENPPTIVAFHSLSYTCAVQIRSPRLEIFPTSRFLSS